MKEDRSGGRARGTAEPPRPGMFIPDLCGIRALFAVVIVDELVAFILTLARGNFDDAASDLALVSLFVQWIGLSAAAVLCLSRRWLRRLPEAGVAVVSYALILAVVVLVCEIAWWIAHPEGAASPLIAGTRASFLFRTSAVGAIVGALVLRYFYVQHHWQLRVASEARARLQALQARIRPHFLFNCMNTIASLTRSDPARAEQAIEDLADLFRATLSEERALVPLAGELALVRRYLDIEALRLQSRLVVEWELAPPPDGVFIPQLSLQPLVENAIYHGIEPAPAGGTIRIGGAILGDHMQISISNPLAAGGSTHAAGNRVAQDNVRQRLAAHFGDAGRLDISAGDGEYRVTVTLPRAPQAGA
jgi:two-component system sensor histidine kinase AlgZ